MGVKRTFTCSARCYRATHAGNLRNIPQAPTDAIFWGHLSLFGEFPNEQPSQRLTLTGLAFAGALSLVCYQSADAVPADAAAINRAAIAASTVQEAQFYARPTRYGVIKCYREFVVGAPRLPPFPSLVVVKLRSSACRGKSRSDFPVAAAKSTG